MRKEIFNSKKPDLGIYMINCGYEDCEDNFVCALHTREYYLIHYVTKGCGKFVADGKSYDVEKGEFFIIRPGELVTYSSPDTENTWSFCWIGFKGRDAEKYLEETGIYRNTAVKKADSQKFRAVVMNCLELFGEDKKTPSQARLSAFVLEALDALKPSEKKRTNPSGQAERALRYIEFNYMRGITARDVAMQLNIDRTHFFRIFKAKTGVSPEKYIMQFRVSKASELLKNSNYTITEIASFVGVSDVYYFSKLFKKITGKSPTEFRKEQSESSQIN